MIYVNKKLIAGIVSVFMLSVLVLPVLSHAQVTPLVQCGNPGQPTCDFNAFIALINRIIQWIISIATTIFAISAIYGGFLYMTSGENAGNKTKALDILKNTLYGFIIILVAWVVVYTILRTFVPNPDSNSIFNFLGKFNK